MPALSPTMESGSVTEWHKSPGDKLAAGDVICDVETDKATVAFDVQDDGVLAKIISAAGSGEVVVGSPVAIIVEDAEAYAAFLNADAAGEVALDGTAAPVGAPAAAAAVAVQEGVVGQGASIAAGDHAAPTRSVAAEFLFAPAARHMAQSKGIDASALQGTGKGGRITKADLVTALANGVVFPSTQVAGASGSLVAQAASPIASPGPAPVAAAVQSQSPPPPPSLSQPAAVSSSSGDFEDHPANNIKKITAKRLTQSKAEVPHLYVSMACEVDALMAFRKSLKKEHDVKVSVNDFIIRSAALALRDVPEANAMWTGGARRAGESIDISVAVATPTGLITPIVTGADKRGLSNISGKVRDLATRARDRQLKPEEFQGGSFTVSNLGMFGINEFSAVINMPQACILAVGGGSPTVKPGREAGDRPRVCSEVTVKLSADRRVVDEAIAAQLLQSFKHYMETPELLMM
ncbi:unnamed protein product [Laminaria digitata]